MQYDVKQFSARGDGGGLDSPAIQSAIDKCSQDGGGIVSVPRGKYLCGTIRLRAGVCLNLQPGAVIQGVNDTSLYPIAATTPNKPGQIQALIWADDAADCSITGQGVIDGGGADPLWGTSAAAVKFRPALVFCRGCRNLKLLDVTLRNSCFWTLHLMRCVDVQVRGITIAANLGRINSDGIDPDGCRNVIISDCNIATGDDSIVLKSTEGDVCENIVVSNCVLQSSCAAIKVGTESFAAIRNVTVSNCVVRDSSVGLALYLKDRGAYENMIFSNLVMETRSPFPVLLDTTPRFYKAPDVAQIRNVTFQNVVVRGPGRLYVEGLPNAPVENLALRSIAWDITGDVDFAHDKPTGSARIELDPSRRRYTHHPYQAILRHVHGLTMEGLRIRDLRRPAKCDRGLVHATGLRRATLRDIGGIETPAGVEPIALSESSDASIVS